jgi:Ca2+-binding EF-hand superfamily protein
MTITDLQARKLDKAFDHFDVDRDEMIERADFAELGARFLLSFGQEPTTSRSRDLLEHFDQVWVALAGTGAGSLSRPEFREGMEVAFIQGNRFAQVLRPAARAVVRLCDTDGDGQISRAEFETMHRAYGTSDRDIAAAFQAIDTNGDGRLSTAELEQAMQDFYVGKKPMAPGNWLFGEI